MPEGFALQPPTRFTAWKQQVFATIQKMHPQPLTCAALQQILDLPLNTVTTALKALRRGGFIALAPGSPQRGYAVRYSIVSGALMPQDLRGKSAGSAEARKRNPRAARGLHHGVLRRQ